MLHRVVTPKTYCDNFVTNGPLEGCFSNNVLQGYTQNIPTSKDFNVYESPDILDVRKPRGDNGKSNCLYKNVETWVMLFSNLT